MTTKTIEPNRCDLSTSKFAPWAPTLWKIRTYSDHEAENLRAYFNSLTSASLRNRFQYSMDSVHDALLSRYSRNDYPFNIGLIAYSGEESKQLCGEALLAWNADNHEAEFALSVGDQFQRQGLGRALVEQLIQIGSDLGLWKMYADTLRSNHDFIALAESLGLQRQSHPDDRRQSRFILNTNPTADNQH